MSREIFGVNQIPPSELLISSHRKDRSLLGLSLLPKTIRRRVELGLAVGTVLVTAISRRPLHAALAVATFTAAFGILSMIVTDCNIISAKNNIAAITTSQAQSSAK